MFGQSQQEALEEWNKIGTGALAHAFVDAAKRISGEEVAETTPIARQLGMTLSPTYVQSINIMLTYALHSLNQRILLDPRSVTDPYFAPIISALSTLTGTDINEANVVKTIVDEENTFPTEDIARAVKDVELPPENFDRQRVQVIMM